jgi:hypothetical protein
MYLSFTQSYSRFDPMIMRMIRCWSYVGRIRETGYQELSLSRSGCVGRGIVKHEFLHALGFIHEQQRPDRDKYVKILYENIKPGIIKGTESYFHRSFHWLFLDARGNYEKYESYSAVNLEIPYDISKWNQSIVEPVVGFTTLIYVIQVSICITITKASL